MRVIKTKDLAKLSRAHETHLAYNGMDCIITHEVYRKLSPLLVEAEQDKSYALSMQEQAVSFLMGIRGIAVDADAKEDRRKWLEAEVSKLRELLNELSIARTGEALNPDSPKQMKEFWFGLTPVRGKGLQPYQGDSLKMKPIYTYAKGEKKLSCDRNTLEKLAQKGRTPALFAKLIMKIRDLGKEAEVFSAVLDSDQRMRCCLNVAGTDTWRWSSNETPEYHGRNMQNISEPLRTMFVPSQGKKIGYADFEQAESRIVAYRTGDKNYIEACEGGDLHTTVCTMVWPDLSWPDDPSEMKAMAEENFYRHFSRRDMSKRGGHATNYYGKPMTVARHLNVETALMKTFQGNYFSAFPGIPAWHEETRETLLRADPIETVFGRKRYFFGRKNDETTLRAAIAFEPQSTLSSICKRAAYLLWQEELAEGWAKSCGFRILHDLHDAVVFEFDPDAEAEVVANLHRVMVFPVEYPAGVMRIPIEVKTGWNWAGSKVPGNSELGMKVRHLAR